MKKKQLYLELVFDIPTLIRLQEVSLAALKKRQTDQDVIDFQEDVLRCLKVLNQIETVHIDAN